MHDELNLQQIKEEWHGTLKNYLIGFFFSLLITLCSFGVVIMQVLPREQLIFAIILFALAQAAIQLKFFLHIGEEPKPRWESISLYFMITVILIIALGTIWIMLDLENRTMHHMQKESMHDQLLLDH